MANPQPDQFTKLSNELLEAMCMAQLSGQEWCVVHTVIRKTYGYGKKSDWISLSQLTEATGLIKQRVNEAKQKLIAKKVLIQSGRKLSLNKDYDMWVKSNGKALLGNGKALQKVTEIRAHKRKKETYTKEISENKFSASNKKDMNWNKRGDDVDEGVVVDFDGDGTTTDLQEEDKKLKSAANKERAEMRRYINGLRDGLGLPKLDPKQMNWQLKDYKILLERGWSHKQIGQEFIHIVGSDIWKEKMQSKQYPGINTVEYNLRNKTP